MDIETHGERAPDSRWVRLFEVPGLRLWDLGRRETAMLVGVLLVTLLICARCLGNGWVYDDHLRIVENPEIAKWSYVWKSFTRDSWWFRKPPALKTFTPKPPTTGPLAGMPRAWSVKERGASRMRAPNSAYYRPMQSAWEGLNYHLFGKDPLGWHLTSVLLHVGVVLLVFRLAWLLSESSGVALLAALLFGVLGAHAEPVAWVSSVDEPLGAFFELAAFCFLIPIYRSGSGGRRLMWPLTLFALSTLSHETAVIFPILVAAYVFLFESANANAEASPTAGAQIVDWRRLGAALTWSAPFFGVSAVYLMVRGLVLGPNLVFGFLHTSATPGIAHGVLTFRLSPANHSPAQILATAPLVLVWYLKLLVIPWLAGPGHEVGFVTTPTLWNFYTPVAILAAIAVGGFVLFSKSPRRNLYFFCAVWWIVTIAPALSLNQIVALVQDRYLYLPSFAFCVLLADWIFQLARTGAVPARAAAVCAAAIILVNMASLWSAQPIWASDRSMWQDCVNEAPDSLRCHLALASALLSSNDLHGALREDLAAQKLAPHDPEIDLSLAAVYMNMNRGRDAVGEFETYYRKTFRQNERQHPRPVIIKLR